MPATQFTCPECHSTLRSATPLTAGRKIKCPKCEAIFPFELTAESTVEDTPPPRPKVVRAAAKREEFAEYDDGREDEEEAVEEEVRPKRPRSKKKRKQDNQRLIVMAVSIAGVVLLLGAGAVAAFVWPGFLKSYPSWEDPLAFVPANSKLVVSVNIDSVADQLGIGRQMEQMFKNLPGNEDFTPANVKKETGLEFREFYYQMTVAVLTPLDGKQDPNAAKFVTVVKSKVPFDPKSVVKSLKITEPPQKLNGKTYYKQTKNGQTAAIFVPSTRLVVVTNLTGDELGTLLASDGAKPALPPDLLTMADSFQQSQVWMVLPMDAAMKQNLQGSLNLVPNQGGNQQASALTAALQQAKVAGFAVAFENNQVKLQGSLACENAAGASQLATELKKQWDLYTKGLPFQLLIKPFLSSMPPQAQELVTELIKTTQFTSANNLAQMSAQVSLQLVKNAVASAQGMMAGPAAGGFPGAGGRPGGGFPRPGGQPGVPGGRRPGGGRPR
jgi:hypothetical protein